MEKEKALDDIDRKEKERKKLEFYQNKKYLEYIMNQKQEAVFLFLTKIRNYGWINYVKKRLTNNGTR
jgi:lysyl-tRNA synthetase class II